MVHDINVVSVLARPWLGTYREGKRESALWIGVRRNRARTQVTPMTSNVEQPIHRINYMAWGPSPRRAASFAVNAASARSDAVRSLSSPSAVSRSPAACC